MKSKIPFIVTFIFFCFISNKSFTQTLYTVLPSSTDSLITQDNYSDYIYVNDNVKQLNKLFLFFPGSGAIPRYYTLILKTAANLGYYAVGLSYNNDRTIASTCSGQNSDCQGLARKEILYGIDYSSEVDVDSTHCIMNRAIKLLNYLKNIYPSQNWGQFLTSQDSVDWSKVCVSGHSQGAGMASMIAYLYPVYRGVFFASGGDWSTKDLKVADWLQWNSETPAIKKFAFTHRNDELLWNYTNITPVIWDTLGLLNFGNYLSVDTLSGNFFERHAFTSNLVINSNSLIKYHNCVVVDAETPMNGDSAVYQPVWNYMLTAPMVTGINNKSNNDLPLSFRLMQNYPNPFNPSTNIRYTISSSQFVSIKVFDILGREVATLVNEEKHAGNYTVEFTINNRQVTSGVYFYQLRSGSFVSTKKMTILK